MARRVVKTVWFVLDAIDGSVFTVEYNRHEAGDMREQYQSAYPEARLILKSAQCVIEYAPKKARKK